MYRISVLGHPDLLYGGQVLVDGLFQLIRLEAKGPQPPGIDHLALQAHQVQAIRPGGIECHNRVVHLVDQGRDALLDRFLALPGEGAPLLDRLGVGELDLAGNRNLPAIRRDAPREYRSSRTGPARCTRRTGLGDQRSP